MMLGGLKAKITHTYGYRKTQYNYGQKNLPNINNEIFKRKIEFYQLQKRNQN